MAALAGLRYPHALIEIDGPNAASFDGSAAPFRRGIMQRRVRMLAALYGHLRWLKTVTCEPTAKASATISPADTLKIDFVIDCRTPPSEHQGKVAGDEQTQLRA